MARKSLLAGAGVVDGAAITLSGLCVIHCLALPMLAAMLPIMGLWAEAEWVHKAFVLAAVPISLLAITRARISRGQLLFIGLAPLGLSLLIAGAFVETFHHIETPLSVAGAILLATAHICCWRFHERRD